MNKMILGLSMGLFACACNNEFSKGGNAPKNTDLIHQNIKGKVQHLEDVPYKVDSVTGKMGEMDTCCVDIQDFDEKGYTTKYHTKDNKGTIRDEYSFNRFDNGLVKEQIVMNAGKKKSSFSIQLNKDSRYGDAVSYDSTGKMDAYYKDVTDNDYNLVTGWTKYKPDSTVESSATREYNKNIYAGFSMKDSTGKVTFTEKAKSDDKGNIVELATTTMTNDSTTNKVVTYKYDSFDEQGNWTQRTEYNDKGKPVKIIKRTITYYKEN